MFIAARQNCIATKAYAPACNPQTTQRMLLAMNSQKPQFLRLRRDDVIKPDAAMVMAMAGH